jgi:hypothetical protein
MDFSTVNRTKSGNNVTLLLTTAHHLIGMVDNDSQPTVWCRASGQDVHNPVSTKHDLERPSAKVNVNLSSEIIWQRLPYDTRRSIMGEIAMGNRENAITLYRDHAHKHTLPTTYDTAGDLVTYAKTYQFSQ